MICPICKKPVERSGEDYPFCSERCRTVDLGNWAMEKYVISSPLSTSENLRDSPDASDDEG